MDKQKEAQVPEQKCKDASDDEKQKENKAAAPFGRRNDFSFCLKPTEKAKRIR